LLGAAELSIEGLVETARMSLFQELDQIHNKMHTLVGRTGESAARVVIPIALAILHQYRKHIDSAGNPTEAARQAVKAIREGGKGALDGILTEFKSQYGTMSDTLTTTLNSVFKDVLGDALPPARLNGLLDYIAGREALLTHFTNEDFLGTMFEQLVSDAFRGDDGKFFTPKNIILIVREMMLVFLRKHLTGSGLFLIYCAERVLERIESEIKRGSDSQRKATARKKMREWAERHLFGIDIDRNISSYACLNMLLHGDGATNIATADSLNHYGVFAHWPQLVMFAEEFAEKWDSLKAKYAASSAFEEEFRFIDRQKAAIKQLAKGKDVEVDLADHKWGNLLQVIATLLKVEERSATGWATIKAIQQSLDFRSIHELMKYEWGARVASIRKGFDLLLTNPPFGRGGKNLQVNAENVNERFILAQYRLATELWLPDATAPQLEGIIRNRELEIETKVRTPKATGRGTTVTPRPRQEIIDDIRTACGGQEWYTVEDVRGPQGQGYTSKITLTDSELGTTHTIYFDDAGLPILFRTVMPKQILFVEQFLRMVRKGGKVFTVLDTGVLSNIDDEYVRRFLFGSAKIHAIVEFPHGAFKAAKADVKSAVLLMERGIEEGKDYGIFGSVPAFLGFNNRRQETPPIFQNDLGKSVCDFAEFVGEPRFCSGDCPWEAKRYCKFGDEVGMTRARELAGTEAPEADPEPDEEPDE
jgi:type I restriction-modification system DNA methylase subunit